MTLKSRHYMTTVFPESKPHGSGLLPNFKESLEKKGKKERVGRKSLKLCGLLSMEYCRFRKTFELCSETSLTSHLTGFCGQKLSDMSKLNVYESLKTINSPFIIVKTRQSASLVS